jgi:transcriptional regulator with XRE-family HTH domain
MSAVTQERQENLPAPAALRRPASGISIDPERLTWWRESRGWSRQDLSDAVTRLSLADDDGAPLTVTRDAIAKNEKGGNTLGGRKPKARTVRALCLALSTPENPCTARDLLPGGEPLPPHREAEVRRLRLEHNRELRDFARAHGVRYRNPVSGRVYYSVPLKAAYDLAVMGAADEVLAGAIATAIAAQAAGQDEPGEDDAIYGLTVLDGIENLDLSVRTQNCLLRGDLPSGHREPARTIGELAAKTAEQLKDFRNFGPASLAEVREQLSLAGFALAGEPVPENIPSEAGNPELLAS